MQFLISLHLWFVSFVVCFLNGSLPPSHPFLCKLPGAHFHRLLTNRTKCSMLIVLSILQHVNLHFFPRFAYFLCIFTTKIPLFVCGLLLFFIFFRLTNCNSREVFSMFFHRLMQRSGSFFRKLFLFSFCRIFCIFRCSAICCNSIDSKSCTNTLTEVT